MVASFLFSVLTIGVCFGIAVFWLIPEGTKLIWKDIKSFYNEMKEGGFED